MLWMKGERGREGGLGDNVEDRDVWGWREVGRRREL